MTGRAPSVNEKGTSLRWSLSFGPASKSAYALSPMKNLKMLAESNRKTRDIVRERTVRHSSIHRSLRRRTRLPMWL